MSFSFLVLPHIYINHIQLFPKKEVILETELLLLFLCHCWWWYQWWETILLFLCQIGFLLQCIFD